MFDFVIGVAMGLAIGLAFINWDKWQSTDAKVRIFALQKELAEARDIARAHYHRTKIARACLSQIVESVTPKAAHAARNFGAIAKTCIDKMDAMK
jgi:hypothetical protein